MSTRHWLFLGAMFGGAGLLLLGPACLGAGSGQPGGLLVALMSAYTDALLRVCRGLPVETGALWPLIVSLTLLALGLACCALALRRAWPRNAPTAAPVCPLADSP